MRAAAGRRAGTWVSRSWRLQQTMECHEHARGRAPDVAFAKRDVVDLDGRVAQRAAAGFVIGRVEQVFQRDFEGTGDFDLVQFQFEAWADESDYWRDLITADDQVIG